MQCLFISDGQVYIIYHQTKMTIAASSSAVSRSIQLQTVKLNQFVQVKHYSFPLLKKVKNKSSNWERDDLGEIYMSSFYLTSFTLFQILKLLVTLV